MIWGFICFGIYYDFFSITGTNTEPQTIAEGYMEAEHIESQYWTEGEILCSEHEDGAVTEFEFI